MFIDIKRDFDSMKRNELIEALIKMKIATKLMQLVEMPKRKTRIPLRTEELERKQFIIQKLVKQEDTLSATLFSWALEHVVHNIDKADTLRTKGYQILAYADDAAIITKQMGHILDELEREQERVKLKINVEKIRKDNEIWKKKN